MGGADVACDALPVSKGASQTSSLDSPCKRWWFLEQAFVCAACATGPQMPATPTSKSQMQWRNAWRSKSLPQLIEPHETDTLQRKATVGNFFAKDEDSTRSSVRSRTQGTSADPVVSPRTESSAAVEVNSDLLCSRHDGQLEVFDNYEFISAVGSGAFGRVLRAKNRYGGQMRACKALTTSTPLERKLVDTEIAILKVLNHPHVLQLYEVYFEPSMTDRRRKVYLITELCTGGDLLFRIAYHYQMLKSPMTEGHVAYQLRQLLSAAMYCHKRGIVHRDVKPDNVLFVDATASSPLKLIDFGLAGFAQQLRENAIEVSMPRSKSLGRLAKILPRVGARWFHVRKQMMQRAGTAFYMAPEMINAGVYDQKVLSTPFETENRAKTLYCTDCRAAKDMFSIGAIMCEMLTGWHPFYTPNVDDAQSVQALQHAFFINPDMPTPYGNTNTGVLNGQVFEGLKQYASYNKLRRASLQLLAQELGEEQVQELRDVFLAMDSGDGQLDVEELREAARKVDFTLSPEEATELIAALGGPSSQMAGYREFIAAAGSSQVQYTFAQLKRCFEKLSTSGVIRFQDMPHLFSHSISESEWEDIIKSTRTADREESPTAKSTISLDKFMSMMQCPLQEGATLPTSSSPLHVHGEDPKQAGSPVRLGLYNCAQEFGFLLCSLLPKLNMIRMPAKLRLFTQACRLS
ncbi:Calcium-dependent protein kinase 5 (PbCDPK5) [Durusdinium trenchii]|uniref:Calcium-dependent protein kinase 5 (PbCDPK5) n=1 Tax=Durusdinium trenchii TaxID=1381693 RepID=A0ABP0QET7_9DINO